MVGYSPEGLGTISIPLPNLSVQASSVRFLDSETAVLDRLIAMKRRLVSLAEERIDQLIEGELESLVSAGAPMVPFKRVTSRIDVGIAEAATHAYTSEGVPLLRSTNIRRNAIDDSDLLYIETWFADRNRSKYVHAGDLLTVRTGAAGTSAVVPSDLHMSQCFTQLISTVRPPNDPRYFAYALNSAQARRYFTARQWGSAQANISVPLLSEAPVPVPSVAEQRRFVALVSQRQADVAALSKAVTRQLGLLIERRSSLISAAVTDRLGGAADS